MVQEEAEISWEKVRERKRKRDIERETQTDRGTTRGTERKRYKESAKESWRESEKVGNERVSCGFKEGDVKFEREREKLSERRGRNRSLY